MPLNPDREPTTTERIERLYINAVWGWRQHHGTIGWVIAAFLVGFLTGLWAS